ncbi:MAG: threonine--tRNA ligase [Acidimicrobiales bacterium]
MPPDIVVSLPDGSEKHLPAGATGADLAASIGPRLAEAAVAVESDGESRDLSRPLEDRAKVKVITATSAEGRAVLRHSTAHVMAQAVLRLWPGARFAIGPAISDGFYYDFELPGGAHFSGDDLARVEAEMRAVMSAAQPFVRQERSFEEGRELFADQPYKVEIIDAAAGAGEGGVTTYRNGDGFVDLCRGPHVASTDRLGHFKLTRVAGAYWRGDEHQAQLQRIYGTAFESEEALQEHLERLRQAEERDHRRLGVELDLFSFPPEIGSGLAVFHPKGGLVRRLMEDYARQRHVEGGYDFVTSPHVAKADLFETSGHLEWFAEGMFPPMTLDDEHRYYVKPMSCPFHILVYRSRQRSYRELPLRFFELAGVYRYEKSGVVHGLTRVRGMTQDDAHIFCSREQMAAELASVLKFVLGLLRDFGLNDFDLELSTRPEGKALGTDQDWVEATEALAAAAAAMDLDLRLDEAGGAFYGPKISVEARDAIGRSWQLSTIQLDFNEPERFGLEYVGPDNARHRPVMIHRALFGSVERFFGLLLEHYGGALPMWLSPVQARVLPVRDSHGDYAERVRSELTSAGIRADVEVAAEPLGARVRRAKLEKIPYVLVVGDDDVAAGTVGANLRGGAAPERGVPLAELVGRAVADGAPPRGGGG